jgi:subtilisin family serine protease
MKKYIIFLNVFLVMGHIFAQHPPQDWYHNDPVSSEYQGIGTYKAYDELLKGRASATVVVAVIDSGVDVEHEDLAQNMWVNADEIPGNGIDDDKNGYVDDIHGWNFIGGKDGKNVNDETLEVTRLYKKFHYKYKDADVSKLSKDQKKEYALYEQVKRTLEGSRESATQTLARITAQKESVVGGLQAVAKLLGDSPVNLKNIMALESDDTAVAFGKNILSRSLAEDETLESMDVFIDSVKEQLKGGEDYYNGQLDYMYNPDFESRGIVGDNYNDPYQKDYGNNDYEGPDALHGTHVAGIIGAVRGNDVGMDGVASNVQIMTIRAVPNGDERDKDVANAIRYAVDNGASVINMSFGKGFSWNKQIVDEAVHYATKNDVLLVHAAGNDGKSNDKSHEDKAGNYPNDTYEKGFGFWFWKKKKSDVWIEVGALSHKTGDESAASFSNYGKQNVDVFAPGEEIYSTLPDDEYRYLQGTSMASPVIAGTAAMLRSYFPALSALQVKEIIMNSSDKLNMDVKLPGDAETLVPFSELSVSGGTVNAYNAVKMAMATKGKKKVKLPKKGGA